MFFASEPLAKPLDLFGKIRVELFLTSEAPDAMLVAKPVDIYPDGFQMLVREGAALARHRNGLAAQDKLDPATPARLAFDIKTAAIVFNRGHRIGLLVAGSSHPAYQIHPNTWDPIPALAAARPARHSLHASPAHPSRLILPIVKPTPAP